MKKLLVYIALLVFPLWSAAQNEQLAMNYFDKGEFEKALVLFQDLEKSQPGNTFFIQRIAASYQQLQQYDKAEKFLLEKSERLRQPMLLVELGYNYQLKKDTAKAEKYYQEAIASIQQNPGNVYGVANAFEQKTLLPQALKAYETAAATGKNMNFDYQMAILQGQLGNTEMMISKLLDYAYANPQNLPVVQNQFSRFMNESEETQESFIAQLRKALLVNAQKTQDIFWNQFLSWFFVQQREYGKAFIQEKAIFKRDPDTFYNIVNLAKAAMEEDEDATAKEIYTFILQNTQDKDIQMAAHRNLLSIDLKSAQEKDYPSLKQRMETLLAQYGVTPYSLALQIQLADFNAFYLKDTKTASAILNKALELQLNKYQSAEVKMKLADILLLDQKFNQAIIYYAQVEEDLKNDAVGHEASMKVARSSYFKGDFEWAQKQLKVLKSSSSQLIANDALELFLLITDNTVEDSTQTALKKFAKADFKLYQNKKQEALAEFKALLQDKTQSIQDVTLLRIGKLYEGMGQNDLALQHYQQIIDKYADGIYIDEALFFSAEIYNKKMNDPEKAKALYEKVIFNHEDSIYFVEARKEYRKLRGDAGNS